MKWMIQMLLLIALFSAATALVGWWGVPLIALAYGAWGYRQPGTVLTAGLAGVASWSMLLAWSAIVGGEAFGRLLTAVGMLFSLPGNGLLVVTVAFAGLLAASASAVARGMRQLRATT